MAGSYRHITDHRNQFKGLALLENLGDAKEAHEELVDMLHYLTGDPREKIETKYPVRESMVQAYTNIKKMFDLVQDITAGDRERIWTAWKYGHLQRACPANFKDESITNFKRYWSEHGETTLAGEPLQPPTPKEDQAQLQTQLLVQILQKLEEIRCCTIDVETAVEKAGGR